MCGIAIILCIFMMRYKSEHEMTKNEQSDDEDMIRRTGEAERGNQAEISLRAGERITP